MSILIEAISVIVRNDRLDSSYPGGVAGYAADCPNHTFCTDGRLTRVGFLSPQDVRFFLEMLESHGLVHRNGAASVDIAVVDQNQGPDPCCLWLEFGHLFDGTAQCWPAGEEAGRLVVPYGWEPGLLAAFEPSPGEPFTRRMRYLRTEDNLDWFQDRSTGQLIGVERTFVTH
jgi:hypothetical protein